jgi:SAM-dependent methyltransferase
VDEVILDVACGTGYGSALLSAKGACLVVGGDISRQAISRAKRFYKCNQVEFVVLSATDLPFRDSSFGVLLSFETIEHLNDARSFLKELRRVLKDESPIALSTPNALVSHGWSYNLKEYTKEEILDLTRQEFTISQVYGQGSRRGKNDMSFIASTFASKIKRLLWRFPPATRIVSFITNYIFKDFHPVDIQDINEIEFRIDVGQNWPYILDGNSTPENIIISGRKGPFKSVINQKCSGAVNAKLRIEAKAIS